MKINDFYQVALSPRGVVSSRSLRAPTGTDTADTCMHDIM